MSILNSFMSALLDESSNNCSEKRATFQIQSDNAKVPSESQLTIALESDSGASLTSSSASVGNEDDGSLRSGRSSASSDASSPPSSPLAAAAPAASSAAARAPGAPGSPSTRSPTSAARRRNNRTRRVKKSSKTTTMPGVSSNSVVSNVPKKESRWQTMCVQDPDQQSACLMIVAPKRCCSPTPPSNRQRRSLNSILDLQCVIDSVMNETKQPAIEKDGDNTTKKVARKPAPCTFDLLQEAIDVCSASPLVAASLKNYEEKTKTKDATSTTNEEDAMKKMKSVQRKRQE